MAEIKKLIRSMVDYI